MEYNELSTVELIKIIEELKRLNRQLLDEKAQEINMGFSWTGNLGNWYWDLQTNTVTFNPLITTTLGYSETEISEIVTREFLTDKIHQDDYEQTMNSMRDLLEGKSNSYEVEYRIKTKYNTYKWYNDRGRITQYDEEGKPLFISGIIFDITEKKLLQLELEQKNKMLAEQSVSDSLTNLKNHRAIIEYLKEAAEESLHTKEPLSIALFDLDNFKKINDEKGHLYGDQVIVDVSKIIQRNIRGNDLAGRYDGEEFLIVFRNATYSQARQAAERIRKVIEQNLFVNNIKITASGGLKEYDGENVTDFIQAADIMLYKAKRHGKNQVL